jgi:hypothetical protein
MNKKRLPAILPEGALKSGVRSPIRSDMDRMGRNDQAAVGSL